MDKRSPQPPKMARDFLRWFCADGVIESLQGDLYELYQRRLAERGKWRADFYFCLEVLDLFRPFAWKKRSLSQTNQRDMLKNHLKVTLRKLWNSPGSNLLNVTGLMLGVLCSIVIFLTIKYETSFDKFHENHDEIYRVTNNYYYPSFTMYVGKTPDPMAGALKNDFPAFEEVFAIRSSYNHNISVGDQLFQSDIIYCGPEFIRTFDYYNDPTQWLIGNPNQILSNVSQTVLTEGLAIKLFRTADAAIGQIITLSNEEQVEVAGVMKDPPAATNFPFEQLISYATFERHARPSFGDVSSTTTFVQLPTAVNVASLRPALDRFNEKYMEAAWAEDFVSTDLQPLHAIHFDERFGSDNYTTNKNYLWTLGWIGIFMILIACINFINLATARGVNRSKEIGMRKILGSSKRDIAIQFMSESFLLALIALGLGVLLAQIAFPYFSELTNLNIGNSFRYTPDLLLFIAGLLCFITLAMGLYPAILFSKFHPLQVVRQKISATPVRGLTLRRSLIAFQLTTSQVLIIGAIVITSQIDYFQSKDLGFQKDSLMVIKILGNETDEKKRAFKQRIQQFPFVERASLNSCIPMSAGHSSGGVTSRDSEIQERFNVQYIHADNDYVDAMNFELLAGQAGLPEIENDSIRGFVVNETLIERLALGRPKDAIGKSIDINGSEARIIGVVKDFHTLSLHENIKPVAIMYGIKRYPYLGIKYKTADLGASIAQIQGAWKEFFPDKNFDFFFQDEQMGHMYDNELRFSKIIKAFTFICVVIACFGLIGLSAFSSARRFKEIGVRKVLGASISSILFLLSKEILVIISISFVISAPIAYYLTSQWLAGFAYNIQLEWWMILLSGTMTLLLALVTVGFQSIKTALINPAISLRKE